MRPARRIAVVGAGRAGSALAALLAGSGWTVAAVASERLADARRLARRCGAPLATTDPLRAAGTADAVLVAVPDRAIAATAALLAGAAPPRSSPPGRGRSASRGGAAAGRWARVALHLSGASGAGLLDPLRRAGWSTGSFHPLVAFPPAGALPPDLRGITVAIDGDAGARRFARAMASSLGAATLSLPARDRARYHLAACFASNYLVTLAAESVALLSGAGIGRARALRAILPLMRATLGNLEASGLAAGLTGPVVRGDDVTLRRHAAVLRRESAGLRELHGLLVRRTALLARSAGRLDAAALRRLDRALGRG